MQVLLLATLVVGATSFSVGNRLHEQANTKTLELPLGGYTGSWPGGVPNILPNINLTVGTPPQPITFMLDTGSSDIWVHSAEQNCKVCTGGAFDGAHSSTFERVSKGTLQPLYADESSASGDRVNDTLGLTENVKLNGFNIGLAKEGPRMVDGGNGELIGHVTMANILGMGLDVIRSSAGYQASGLLEQLVREDIMRTRSFSLYFDSRVPRTRGGILFGGFDRSKFSGELTILPLLEDEEFHEIRDQVVDLAAVELSSGHSVEATWPSELTKDTSRPRILLDTGADIVTVPDKAFNGLVKKLGLVEMDDDDFRYHVQVPCDVVTRSGGITFALGRFIDKTDPVKATIPFSELVYPAWASLPANITQGRCMFKIERNDAGDPVAGVPLMKAMYTVFNIDEKTIGLAPAVRSQGPQKIEEIHPGDAKWLRRS